MGIPLVRREAETAGSCRDEVFLGLGMSRQVATQSLRGDSYAQTVSGLRRHRHRHIVVLSLVRQAIRMPMPITCGWKTACRAS